VGTVFNIDAYVYTGNHPTWLAHVGYVPAGAAVDSKLETTLMEVVSDVAYPIRKLNTFLIIKIQTNLNIL
jgi:hypothetical protein